MTTTNRYEFLLVLPARGADETKATIDRLTRDFESDGATIEQVQNMDRRDFTYVAGEHASGIFVNIIAGCAPETVAKLQARLKLDDEVYRQHCQKLAPKKVASGA